MVARDLEGLLRNIQGRLGTLERQPRPGSYGQSSIESFTLDQLAAGAFDTRYYTEAEIAAMFAGVKKGQIPSSVVVGSGSASVAADGTVTATGCSSVSLNDIFDGTGPDIYQVIVDGDLSASATFSCRLRASGSDTSTGNHVYIGVNTVLGSGPSRTSTTTATSFGFFMPSAAGSTSVQGNMMLFGPNKTPATFHLLNSISAAAGDRWFWQEGGNDGGGIRTGLSFICSAGNYTGSIKVVKLA